MPLYGLIGYPLSHSFSKKFFTKKFENEGLDTCSYENFEIASIREIKNIITVHPSLRGLNVTVPYKTSVIPFLNEMDKTAAEINAVNIITVINGKLKGYNSDWIGFESSLKNFIKNQKPSALILGTGGSAKAVEFGLKKWMIDYLFVSREKRGEKIISYYDLSDEIISDRKLIINCTPLGRFPQVEGFPPINYNMISSHHFLFDLNYNPQLTAFMLKGLQKKAMVKNGDEMLITQAEEAWKIWNRG